MIRLIVGLGNPGGAYKETRHNAGMWFIDALCQRNKISLKPEPTLCGSYGRWYCDASTVTHLGIPDTFVNHSGRAVSAVTHYYKIPPKEVLIVHDELDFVTGVARFKWGGGSGGHNGLKDIIKALDTADFWRLRLGIGHPHDKARVPHYVLTPPPLVDCEAIQCAIQSSLLVLESFCVGQAEQAMNSLHQ